MKSTLLASTALALVLSTGVAFAGPTATITDRGTSNLGTITQNAGVNVATDATITQRDGSSSNQAYITQAGAGENNGTIDQAVRPTTRLSARTTPPALSLPFHFGRPWK